MHTRLGLVAWNIKERTIFVKMTVSTQQGSTHVQGETKMKR